MFARYRLVLIYLFVVSLVGCQHAQFSGTPPPSTFAVASAHPLATHAGIKILQQDGNAFDAAVAVSAVLAVVEPYSSGLGGGGFWLLHVASTNRDIMIDGRERAPFAANRDMYLDADGKITTQSIDGPLAAGIPGVPAALVHIAKRYGRMPLTKTLAPAIYYAQTGIAVDPIYLRLAQMRLSALHQSKDAAHIFLEQNQVPNASFRLVQKDLASTLQQIVVKGHAGFYGGEIASKLVQGVRAAGGIWQVEDLSSYQIVEREPIRGTYKDIQIVSAAPPSSGGVVLVQALNMISPQNIHNLKKVDRVHVVVEAMRRAYRDRAVYLGDPDHVSIPTPKLLDVYYARMQFQGFNKERATPSESLVHEEEQLREGNNTTHFSILDSDGNYVAATLSINYPFGSGFVPAGTGVLLNDEMDDFVAKPGTANVYGLVGGEANAIAPGKRMLSSMSPTFLRNDNRLAILGTPGGSRIISMVLLATLAFAENMEANQIVSLPRYHHQYLPDEIQFEKNSFTADELKQLAAKGHALKLLDDTYGNMQIIMWDKKNNHIRAASDPRGIGSAHVDKKVTH